MENEKEKSLGDFSLFLAEREGFEPPAPLSATVFKTVVIDHSTISPTYFDRAIPTKKRAKLHNFDETGAKIVGFSSAD